MKLVVSDVDGTLVADGSPVINPAYYDVIRQIKANGNLFVVASGRQIHSIQNVFEPIAKEGEFYAIAEGGALIFHNDTIVSHEIIDEQVVDEMLCDIRKLKERGCDVMLSGLLEAYCPHKDSELYRWMTNSYRYEIRPMGGYQKLPRKDVLKISIYHPFDCEGVCREWFYEKWEKRMMLSSAGANWVDCVLPTSTKGTALKKIQEMTGIDRADTIVFGDNINDIPMFLEAGISNAVANARERTKSAATKVIGSYSEDGVLKELKALLLNGTL